MEGQQEASVDYSSGDDSDDEFLTLSSDKRKGKLDREALVRKKLLENFYGKSAVADNENSSNNDDDSTDDEDEYGNKKPSAALSAGNQSPSTKRSPKRGGTGSTIDDLDSNKFSAVDHTRKHVMGSSVQSLLDTEERLALEVRTLDSTMQTLVYENYSRFIDATDAIRSVSVNVQANEEGLARLMSGMQVIDSQSHAIEEELGSLRDQVAEKIRIKRLLTRLDALLKLPNTLHEQIDAGKYRTATRSYLKSSSILSKHSAGFESLKNIETECNTIFVDMKKELKRKLLHWSGNLNSFGPGLEVQDSVDSCESYSNPVTSFGEQDNNTVDPPKNMTEIFECAGTLFILHQNNNQNSAEESGEDNDDLSEDDLQSMALAASTSLLDRLLDTHLIEIQERRFASAGLDPTATSLDSATQKVGIDQASAVATSTALKPIGGALIPSKVLDAILEAATLFGMSFGSGSDGSMLVGFVTESFSSFMAHVKSIFLEESAQVANSNLGEIVGANTAPEPSENAEEEEEAADAVYEAISGALSILLRSVRELASGLALPDVGIRDCDGFANNLVDQAMKLTEFMVRRRVDQKFYDLRISVVRDCLIPFTSRAVDVKSTSPEEDSNPSQLPQIVQVASSSLSDCFQLVDDTIRSIFSGGTVVLGDSSSPDLPILKQAVESSTRRFAWWLASALELLAGGEPSDAEHVVEVSSLQAADGFTDSDLNTNFYDQNDLPGQDNTVIDLLDVAISNLLSFSEERGSGTIHSDFVLALTELCRLAERSVAENLDQSISAHVGGGKKKGKKGIFPSNELSPSNKPPGYNENEISARFNLAASRVLVIYAENRGADMADFLCSNLVDAAKGGETARNAPREEISEALSVAKTTAIECASIFGENKRASPLTVMDESSYNTFSRPSLTGPKTGLQLDVSLRKPITCCMLTPFC